MSLSSTLRRTLHLVPISPCSCGLQQRLSTSATSLAGNPRNNTNSSSSRRGPGPRLDGVDWGEGSVAKPRPTRPARPFKARAPPPPHSSQHSAPTYDAPTTSPPREPRTSTFRAQPPPHLASPTASTPSRTSSSAPTPPPSNPLTATAPPPPPRNPPQWLKHRTTLRENFPTGWAPPKRISREAIDLLRVLQQSDPTLYTTPVLAERFKISPEAVRRILKSRFVLDQGERLRRETKRKAERLRMLAEQAVLGDGPAAEARVGAEKKELGVGRKEARASEPARPSTKSWAGDVGSERDEMRRLREAFEREQGEA